MLNAKRYIDTKTTHRIEPDHPKMQLKVSQHPRFHELTPHA